MPKSVSLQTGKFFIIRNGRYILVSFREYTIMTPLTNQTFSLNDLVGCGH